MRLAFFKASVNLCYSGLVLASNPWTCTLHAHTMYTHKYSIHTHIYSINTQYTITGVLHRDMLNAQRILSFSHIAHALFFTHCACALVFRKTAVVSLLLLSSTRHRHLHTRLVLASSLWPWEPVRHWRCDRRSCCTQTGPSSHILPGSHVNATHILSTRLSFQEVQYGSRCCNVMQLLHLKRHILPHWSYWRTCKRCWKKQMWRWGSFIILCLGTHLVYLLFIPFCTAYH